MAQLGISSFEPPHDKTNKMTFAPSEDSESAWASAQSDQSLRCPHEETLGPQLPIERTDHFVGFVMRRLI